MSTVRTEKECTASSAVLIAVAAGGVGVLNTLRGYSIAEKNSKRVVLKR